MSSDKSSNILATCEGACLIIPAQRHHVTESLRRGCSVRLTLDPCGSFMLSGMMNRHDDSLTTDRKTKLLFQVNLHTVKSYNVSGLRDTLHSIVMANGRAFQLKFEESQEFDAFKPYIGMAIESLKLNKKSEDFLIVEPPNAKAKVGKDKTSGPRVSPACDTQATTYLSLLSDEQIDSLDDDGYERICEAKLSTQSPATSTSCAPPLPKRSGLKSEPQHEDNGKNTDTINRRPLPPLPRDTRARNAKKLDVSEKPVLSKRSKSEDWSRDDEGYELPRQINASYDRVLKSNEALNEYTRLSSSYPASPPSANNSLTGSQPQLNKVLPHPRVVRLAESRLKTRSTEELNSSTMPSSTDNKAKNQRISRVQCKEYPKKVQHCTKMKHAESHGDLSAPTAGYESTWGRPVRDARSVTPPPSYAPLTTTRPSRGNRSPTPSNRRCINISAEASFRSESTFAATSCPDGLNRIETRSTQKFWSTTPPTVREALSSMSFAPVACSLPNLARGRDALSTAGRPPTARSDTSSVGSLEDFSHHQHRMIVLKLRKNVKQTVVHSKLGTYVN